MATTEQPPIITAKQVLDLVASLGIATERIREVHFNLGRITVTRRQEFAAGTEPVNEESLWHIETYPIVRHVPIKGMPATLEVGERVHPLP
jgi:hypothetical protein